MLTGIEAVIDKDHASELLARELDADLFVMATDVDAVYDGWGTPESAKAHGRHARGAAAGHLRRRLDGAEGRRGGAVRRAHGAAGRHRLAGRHRADRRGDVGTNVVQR